MRTVFSFAALLYFGVAGGVCAADVNQDLSQFSSSVRNYNVLSLGSSSLYNYNSVEGGVATLGSLSMTGGAIGSRVSAGSDPTLYVGGSVSINGYVDLNNGYASLPGVTSYTWDSGQKRLTTGGGTLSTSNSTDPLASRNPVTNPIPSWTSLSATLQAVSADLRSIAANGTIAVSNGNLTFSTSLQSGVAVFNLDAGQLNNNSYNGTSFSNLSINVPADVTFVVNVLNASGKTLFGSGVNFNQGANNDHLLWNIVGTGSVSLGGGHFYGSVLAAGMSVSNANNTYINGQLAVGSFTLNNAGLQFTQFKHPVPEPSLTGVVMLGSALAAFFGLRSRKVRRTPQRISRRPRKPREIRATGPTARIKV